MVHQRGQHDSPSSQIHGCSLENVCVPTCRIIFFLVLFTNSCFPVRLEKAREQSDQAPFVWGFFCFGLVLVVGLGFFLRLKAGLFFHRKQLNGANSAHSSMQATARHVCTGKWHGQAWAAPGWQREPRQGCWALLCLANPFLGTLPSYRLLTQSHTVLQRVRTCISPGAGKEINSHITTFASTRTICSLIMPSELKHCSLWLSLSHPARKRCFFREPISTERCH